MYSITVKEKAGLKKKENSGPEMDSTGPYLSVQWSCPGDVEEEVVGGTGVGGAGGGSRR